MLPVIPDKVGPVSVIYDGLEYFSASGIAGLALLGVPKSRIGIYKLAEREGWQYILVAGKGRKDGVKYFRVPDYLHILIIDARESYKYQPVGDEKKISELKTDRRVSQATFKEAQSVADVDYDLLEAAELAVHEFMEEEGFVQPPARVAKLVVAIYRYAVAEGVIKPASLKSFLKLVA